MSAHIRSLGQWHLELSINGYHDVTRDNEGASLYAWRMKQSQSWLRWNKNVQSRFAVLHFGDGRLHEVLKGPQSVLEGGAYFRRRAGDALHQRGVQRDHLSPYVTVHWWRDKRDTNERQQRFHVSEAEGRPALTVLRLCLLQRIHECTNGFQDKDDLSHLLSWVKDTKEHIYHLWRNAHKKHCSSQSPYGSASVRTWAAGSVRSASRPLRIAGARLVPSVTALTGPYGRCSPPVESWLYYWRRTAAGSQSRPSRTPLAYARPFLPLWWTRADSSAGFPSWAVKTFIKQTDIVTLLYLWTMRTESESSLCWACS